jgi:hypothetical protein
MATSYDGGICCDRVATIILFRIYCNAWAAYQPATEMCTCSLGQTKLRHELPWTKVIVLSAHFRTLSGKKKKGTETASRDYFSKIVGFVIFFFFL